jgi:hypothetical protein
VVGKKAAETLRRYFDQKRNQAQQSSQPSLSDIEAHD